MKLNQKDRFKLAIEILVEEIHIRKKRNFFPPSIIIHPFFDLIPFEGKSGEFERNGIIFLIHSYFHLPRHVFSIFLSSFVSLISERNISLDRVARDRYNCEWDYTLVRILFNAFTLRSSFRALLRDGYIPVRRREREREGSWILSDNDAFVHYNCSKRLALPCNYTLFHEYLLLAFECKNSECIWDLKKFLSPILFFPKWTYLRAYERNLRNNKILDRLPINHL